LDLIVHHTTVAGDFALCRSQWRITVRDQRGKTADYFLGTDNAELVRVENQQIDQARSITMTKLCVHTFSIFVLTSSPYAAN